MLRAAGGAPSGIWRFKGCGLWLLSEGEPAARRGDGAAEFFGDFNPLLNDDFDVGESFLVSAGSDREKSGTTVLAAQKLAQAAHYVYCRIMFTCAERAIG
jgi:hypothetical protein